MAKNSRFRQFEEIKNDKNSKLKKFSCNNSMGRLKDDACEFLFLFLLKVYVFSISYFRKMYITHARTAFLQF